MALPGSYRMAALHPGARAILIPVVDAVEAAGLPFEVYETARTRKRQHSLFMRGASKIDDDGAHVRLGAMDFVLHTESVDGAHGPWDLGLDAARRKVERPDVWAHWVALAKVIVPLHRKRVIRWGGAWGARGLLIGWDPYHVEIPRWWRLPMPKQP